MSGPAPIRFRESEIRQKHANLLVGLKGWKQNQIGEIYTRGKHAPGDDSKAMLLKEAVANSVFPDAEYKGVFILPYDYGIAGNLTPDVGSVWRTYFHQMTWMVMYNDERKDDDGRATLTSFDFFTDKIDLFIELYDYNVNLGFPAGQGYHTGVRTREPLYDHIADGVAVFHIAKFIIETRVLQSVFC